jgi:hypothetical protein
MKPPELKRFNEGDYPNAPSWFPAFIGVLNRFMEQVFQILNRNTTIGENVTGRYFQTSFKTRSDYAAGAFDEISISWPFAIKPSAVLIGQVNRNDDIKILKAVTPQWVFSSSGITVVYVAGLEPSTSYSITFLCL